MTDEKKKLPSFDTGGSGGAGSTTDDSSYKVPVGFGLKDKDGNPLELPPLQIGAYITSLAGRDAAAYSRVKSKVAALTGRKTLDPNYVGGYVTKIAQNIMASSDIIAKSGNLEDYFNTAIKTAGGNAQSSLPQSYLSSPTQAKSDIITAFKDLGIDRDPTTKEITALTKVLNDAQKKNPSKYVNGTTYGGLDKKQFLIDVISSGKYEGNPKFYPTVLSNLGEEAAGYKATAAATKAGKEESITLTNRNDILKTAQANGVPLSEEEVNSYINQTKAGKNIDVILQGIRDAGASGLPDNVKKIVASGVDLSTVYAPYKNILAQTLEINPNDITLNDPTLRMAIGPDKEMPLYEYQRALRKDNRWQYTDQARSEASDAAQTILKDFGFMG